MTPTQKIEMFISAIFCYQVKTTRIDYFWLRCHALTFHAMFQKSCHFFCLNHEFNKHRMSSLINPALNYREFILTLVDAEFYEQ